jgi:hypothetical protein
MPLVACMATDGSPICNEPVILECESSEYSDQAAHFSGDDGAILEAPRLITFGLALLAQLDVKNRPSAL